MFDLDITITAKGWNKRTANKVRSVITKEALKDLARWYHIEIFPAHFQPDAHARYAYHEREIKWQERKQRTTGQNIDMVYRGQMQNMMVHQRKSPTGSAKRVRLKIPGPAYLYYHSEVHELGRITHGELQEMTKRFDEFMQKRLDELLKHEPDWLIEVK